MGRNEFLIALLFVFLAAVVQVKFLVAYQWTPSVVLATLVAAAFFLDGFTLLLLALVGVLLLNWQPAVSIELAVVVGLPLVFFALRRTVFTASWLAVSTSLVAATLAFYLVVGASFIPSHTAVVVADVVVSMFVGLGVFRVLTVVGNSPPCAL